MTSKVRSLLTLSISIALMLWLYPKASQPEGIRELLQTWGTAGVVLDLLILALQMLFPIIPFPLLAGINALAFGWPLGFLFALSGSMLGSSLGFWLTRNLTPQRFRTRLSIWFQSRGTTIQEGFIPVFLARLVPFVPAAAVNYLAGLSSVRFATFFWASLLGKIPIIAWETTLGQNVWQISSHPWRFLLTLSAGLAVLPAYLYYQKIRSRKRTQAKYS